MTKPNLKDKQTMILDIRQLVPLDQAEYYLLCLNQNTWLLVQMLHSFYGSWRNRYSQNVDIEEPLQPNDTEWRMILDIFNQGERELSQVTCITDLVESLEGIKQAIIDKEFSPTINCGGGGGCSGGTGSVIDSPAAPGQPSLPGDGPGGYPPPDDWEGTTEEYKSHKCKAANFIYDSLYNSMIFIGSLYTAAGAISAGAALGSWLLASVAAYSPIGVIGVSIFAVLTGWEVALIVGLVATASLVVGGSVLYVFIEAAEELETRKQEFICALYTAKDPAEAAEAAGNILAEAIDVMDLSSGPLAGFAETARSLMSEVIEYFFPNTLMNHLFEETAEVLEYAGSDQALCNSCDEHWYSCIFGDVISDDETEIVIASMLGSEGEQAVILGIEAAENWGITLVSGSFTPPPTIPECVTKFAEAPSICPIGCGNPEWDLSWDEPIFGTFNDCGTVMYRSNSNFTIKIERL